jgi:hypothetical protein
VVPFEERLDLIYSPFVSLDKIKAEKKKFSERGGRKMSDFGRTNSFLRNSGSVF